VLGGHNDAVTGHEAPPRRQRKVGRLADGDGQVAGAGGGGEAQAALVLRG
jgi:hypothetical protein